jgi:YegS/Rv2252/BmrU family lipid kinase
MRRRFFLIVNPAAGIAGVPLVDDVVRELARHGASITRAEGADVPAARHAARQAADSGSYDAIIAAGGDGTIRHVAAALLGSPVDLGIIPVGTGNVLAHEIGLGRSARAVARMLCEGPTAKVACAQVNGEPFLLMVGVGFDARVVAGLDQRLKSRLGKAAYAGPVLGAIISPMDSLSVTVDGRRYNASWAVIANARHYGGPFVLAPRTGIQERGLEAILFRTPSRAALVGELMSLAAGRLAPHTGRGSDVEMLPCSRVTVTARRPVPVQVDGDVFGTTPVEIDAGTGEIRLIIPEPAGGGGGGGNSSR